MITYNVSNILQNLYPLLLLCQKVYTKLLTIVYKLH